MRITQSISQRSLLANIESLNERLEDASLQVTSGKKISTLSDSPSKSAQLVQVRDQLEQVDQYVSSTDTSSYFLSAADTALTSVYNTMTTIQSRGSSAASGTSSASDRASLAKEVRSLRDDILALANTKARGRYIFSGSRINTAAFSISGDTATYQGDTQVNSVKIGDGAQVNLNVVGSTAFSSIFSDIQALLTAMDADDEAGIKSALDQFKVSRDNLSQVRTQVGADLAKTKDIVLEHDSRETDLKALKSSLEDADVAEAASELTQVQTALRAALSAGSIVHQRNLFDFLV